ncbi:MAG TPA: N-acetyl-gamma-glutamyl-phosphate reductase [Thermoanaerobaculia bacterium]|jgi:N-acetyl-gamma-glutamyl-phosphate reductase|nr:N-acetyl-gamma-glutamyl-phosphate reductase [Thermoanaerobaculia bacterium]
MERIRASVAGASGYAGGEVVRWLSRHPRVELVHLTAFREKGRPLADVFPNLRGFGDQTLNGTGWLEMAAESDVVFLALPHGAAVEAVPVLIEAGTRVVDLGADFRLKDPASYAQWYGSEHGATELLGEAVYGLPEQNRERVRSARLIANPGCYPTAAALALLPLLASGRVGGPVIVDAKSGVSGAGRNPSAATHFSEVNENVKPYKLGVHRHGPEMEQTFASAGTPVPVYFAPHLTPMTRGILATCYAPLSADLSPDEALSLYREAYRDEPFVRVLEDELPQTKATLGSNFCDVAVRVDSKRRLAVAVSAIDNLVKGAAGQAIQNMNLMFGFPETEGLWAPAVFP